MIFKGFYQTFFIIRNSKRSNCILGNSLFRLSMNTDREPPSSSLAVGSESFDVSFWLRQEPYERECCLSVCGVLGQASMQAGKKVSKPKSKPASKQAKQAGKQAGKANSQASKLSSRQKHLRHLGGIQSEQCPEGACYSLTRIMLQNIEEM